jgi:membrane-associated HD superfamily phosphohydrolase
MRKRKWTLFKHKFLLILIALIAFFVINALSNEGWLEYSNMIIMTILVACSMLSLEGYNNYTRILGLILGIAGIVISGFTSLKAEPQSIQIMRLLVLISFFSIITTICLVATLKKRIITSNVLYGAISSYLLIGLVFAIIYSLIHVIDHNAFSLKIASTGTPALQTFIYYSFVTLTTLGYGDITPLSDISRTLAWLEAAFGQVYLTILIAQLVGTYIAQKGRISCEK